LEDQAQRLLDRGLIADRTELLRLILFKGWTPCPHAEWLAKLRNEKSRSSEAFVKNFADKYGDNPIGLYDTVISRKD
ncbi:hypothetical protein RZS08_02345, partial [Arthrospira platensis SPKY1]|nr:hypothetical protein [Arthrospira platensis SPKY1]